MKDQTPKEEIISSQEQKDELGGDSTHEELTSTETSGGDKTEKERVSPNPGKIEKRKRLVRIVCMAADIIVILAIIALFFYLAHEKKIFETLGQDVCKLCELKVCKQGMRLNCIPGFSLP